MQLGTTKDQGLYNKPSAAVHPGALAGGTLPQYNTIDSCKILHSEGIVECNLLIKLKNTYFQTYVYINFMVFIPCIFLRSIF